MVVRISEICYAYMFFKFTWKLKKKITRFIQNYFDTLWNFADVSSFEILNFNLQFLKVHFIIFLLIYSFIGLFKFVLLFLWVWKISISKIKKVEIFLGCQRVNGLVICEKSDFQTTDQKEPKTCQKIMFLQGFSTIFDN